MRATIAEQAWVDRIDVTAELLTPVGGDQTTGDEVVISHEKGSGWKGTPFHGVITKITRPSGGSVQMGTKPLTLFCFFEVRPGDVLIAQITNSTGISKLYTMSVSLRGEIFHG